MGLFKRIAVALLVAAVAAAAAYMLMDRDGIRSPKNDIAKATGKATDLLKDAADAARSATALSETVRRAGTRVKELVTTVPRMYEKAAGALSGDATM